MLFVIKSLHNYFIVFGPLVNGFSLLSGLLLRPVMPISQLASPVLLRPPFLLQSLLRYIVIEILLAIAVLVINTLAHFQLIWELFFVILGNLLVPLRVGLNLSLGLLLFIPKTLSRLLEYQRSSCCVYCCLLDLILKDCLYVSFKCYIYLLKRLIVGLELLYCGLRDA